ncbi:MAG: 5-formyltetrahydrofolate cyclo-ligase [Rhodobacteraceae bacterium]|jgi:5,10-methenyltetrahydrofolate synthetase|nr:5-formyltetrahydrofolate cyclo-ligase [Paracoccaceae bacterium]
MTDDTAGEEPCFAHLLAGGHVVDPEMARDVARFRRAERERLYALRRAVPVAARRAMEEGVAAGLDALDLAPGIVVSGYWPIRGELDLRPWLARAVARGLKVALPVVVARDAPLVFREWTPGAQMVRGAWNIPVPAEGADVTPDVVLAPLVGVDRAGYRLGNGGGYFDRTLAGMTPREIVGVGHDFSRIDTIFPMPWDIPMTRVILGDGTVTRPVRT